MKKLLCFILSLAMILSTIVLAVSADSTPAVTAPMDITGYSYDANSKTITLDNASSSKGFINIVGTDVTINLVGTSTITSSSYGIVSNGSVKFSGDGSLTINAGASSPAIDIQGGNKALDFSGTGTITINTSNIEAIKVDGQITFNSGTVTATTSSNYPAIIAYGVTKKDIYNNVVIDDEVGIYAINMGTDMAPTTSVNVVNVGGTTSKDEYYEGSTITDKYGNTYTKHIDQYGNVVIDEYDKYGNRIKDAYAADNATGASWAYSMSHSIKTFSSGSVSLDAKNWTYSGSPANSVTIRKKTTPPTPPTEKITTNKYPLKNAGSTAVIDKISFGTTVDQLKNNLDNQNAKLKVYNISGKEVTGSSLVGTKFVVKLFVNNQEMDKRTLVVLGDVFAQDKVDVNSQDYMMIRQHIMANYKYITDAILLLAADAYSDSTVDSRDYMMIRQIIMAK